MFMLLELAFLVLSPVALAYSRYQEHEADRFALDLTHTNHPAAPRSSSFRKKTWATRDPAFSTKSFGQATRVPASGSISATHITPGSRTSPPGSRRP